MPQYTHFRYIGCSFNFTESTQRKLGAASAFIITLGDVGEAQSG